MPKCKLPLDSSETELGTWTANFIIPDTGSYFGDLTITNKNIIFLSQFDISLSSIVDVASFEIYGNKHFMIIPRKRIVQITPRKSMLNKRITIMTSDNSEFIIDYGVLSIDSILSALNK